MLKMEYPVKNFTYNQKTTVHYVIFDL